MVASGAHLAGESLQDGEIFLMRRQRPEPLGQIVPVEIHIDRLLAFLTLHRLGIETGRHTHARPQAVAPVHKNETGRRLGRCRRELRRIQRRQCRGAQQRLLQKISASVHGCSLCDLR